MRQDSCALGQDAPECRDLGSVVYCLLYTHGEIGVRGAQSRRGGEGSERERDASEGNLVEVRIDTR